ncbi:nitrous oxide reductase family maturation protein NosD [Chloroflexota bacterium]
MAIAAVVLIFTAGTLPAVIPDGAIYYVAENGSDSDPGTLAKPWRTLAHANHNLRPGDTVYVRAGTYDEVIEPRNSGTLGKAITYAGYWNEKVIIAGEGDADKLVFLRDKSHIVVDGFTISYGHPPPGGNRRWPWIRIAGNAQHNVVRNCTIIQEGDPLELFREGYNYWGVFLEGGGVKHNLIEDNYVRGVAFGIHLTQGPQYNVVQGNHIAETGGGNIIVGTSSGVIQGNLIQDNLLELDATSDGIQFTPNQDLPDQERQTDVSNFGTIIRNNVIRYCNEDAIDLKGAAHVVIENNVVYGHVGSSDGPLHGWNRRSQGTIMRGSNTSSRDVIIRRNLIYDSAPGIWAVEGWKIYNNTLVNNNRDYTGSDSEFVRTRRPDFFGVMQWERPADGLAIQNNIIVEHNQAEVVLSMTGDKHIDHNLYYNSRLGARFVNLRDADDWDTLGFSQWQMLLSRYRNITGGDSHSFVADPMFVNAPERPVGEHEQFDFHLQDDSPAIDAGGPLTRVEGSGSGNQVQVEDAGYFYDGYGVTLGDLIQIGKNHPVRITAIDYDGNVITVGRSVTWADGAGVGLRYDGKAPDIGAFEHKVHCLPAPLGGVCIVM